jgi:hypothetical protein
MLSLLAWCGVLPKKSDKEHMWEVFSKLGGNFLGRVPKSRFVKNALVRDLQNQIALFYKHSCRPSRYLVIWWEDQDLSSFPNDPNFPFDSSKQKRSCIPQTLHDVGRIDVMYNENDDFAMLHLSHIRIDFVGTQLLLLSRPIGGSDRLAPQTEVLGFKYQPVKSIVTNMKSNTLDLVSGFPLLEELRFEPPGCLGITSPLFEDLVQLKRLSICFDIPSLPNNIELMVNLTSLELELKKIYLPSVVPSELGLLTNLTSLSITGLGFGRSVPTQLGNLSNLRFLTISKTSVKALPSELGNLASLEHFTFEHNKCFDGNLPHELFNLTKLRRIFTQETKLSCGYKETNMIGLWVNDVWWRI